MSDNRRTWLLGVLGAVSLCVGLLGVVWFTTHAGPGDRAHDRAVALWESKEPAAYSFDYTHCGGMCALCRVHVTVEEGRVASAVPVDGDCSTAASAHAPTIDEVFALEESDRHGPMADSFEIRYDPTWGFPATVTIRCPPDVMDCGQGYAVTDFEAFR